MRGGKRAGHRREGSWSPLPVPCLSPLPRGVTGRVTGPPQHALGLAPCPPCWGCARCLQAEREGGLTMPRPLASAIHAEQLFLLGACSWMRLRSGSTGAERGGKGSGGTSAPQIPRGTSGNRRGGAFQRVWPSGLRPSCGAAGWVRIHPRGGGGCRMLVSPHSLGFPPHWVFFRSICQGLELLPDRIW